jgi:hypothetical protein
MSFELDEVRRVADGELLSRLERLVRADRALSVKLLVHLGEVEERKPYLERGSSSMYAYCMTSLGMSEAETYLRLLAAKTGKRIPLVLERLADGGLHLTAIKLLAPLLTVSNHVVLLDRARGMSKRQLEVLVAELAPKVDVPERMRKLPESRGAAAVAALGPLGFQAPGAAQSAADGGVVVHAAADGGVAGGCSEMALAAAAGSDDALRFGGPPAVLSQPSIAAQAAQFVLQPPPARSSLSPLSPGRFKLELTLGQEAHDQLEQLRELLRHQNPSGEITRIVERALRELLERTLKERFAQSASPRRQGVRAQSADAVARAAETNDGSVDVGAVRSGGSTESRERDAAPHRDALLAAGEQQADAGAADATAGSADEPQCGCSSGGRAHDGVLQSEVFLVAGRMPLDERSPEIRGASAAAQHEPRTVARSRYVPRGVLREIYARDDGQCSFVSADGQRCASRGFLEVHHHEAFARGGTATVDNLRLACRAHNFWLAERELGRGFMRSQVRAARARQLEVFGE